MKIPPPMVYAVGLLVTRGLALVSLPIVSRALGPESWGQLDLIVTLVDLVALVIGLGLVEAIQRRLSLARAAADTSGRQQSIAEGAGSLLLLVLGFGALLQIFVPLLMAWLPTELTALDLRLALITGCCSALLAMPLMVLRSEDRAWTYVGVSFGITASQTALTVTAALLGYGVTAILAAGTVVHLVGVAGLLIAIYRNDGITFSTGALRGLAAYGTPIALGGVAAFCYQGLDRWVVAAWVTPEALGSYGAAVRIALLSALAFQPFQLWWSPRRLEWLAGGDLSRVQAGATVGVIWAIMVAVLLALSAPLLEFILFGEAFEINRDALLLLLMTFAARSATDALNGACFLLDSSVRQMVIQWVSAFASVIAMLALVPFWGVTGAAAGLLAGAVLRLVLFLIASQRTLRVAYPILPLSGLAGIGIASAVLPINVTSIAASVAVLIVAALWGGRSAARLRAEAA